MLLSTTNCVGPLAGDEMARVVSRRRTGVTPVRHRERGIALIAAGMWLFALLGITAIAVEVAHLTDTATEVQVAADAGALGAALQIALGQNGQAIAAGKNIAGANFANGSTVASSAVQIDIGHYNPDPTIVPHFTATCTPGVDCNAAKATVKVTAVKYIMASILNGQSGTDVTKNAVAAAECQGSSLNPLPMAICDSALRSIGAGDVCGPVSASFAMNPNGGQSACWTSLSPTDSVNDNTVKGIFPTQCGGTPVTTSVGEQINLGNGVSSAWQLLQCCIACANQQDFTVPVVSCGALAQCNHSSAVLGFATIHIELPSDVTPPGQRNGGTPCQSQFPGHGCQARPVGSGSTPGIVSRQICKSDLAGAPGGANCSGSNFGNTVAPVLGQVDPQPQGG
jgi:hypothetical protein